MPLPAFQLLKNFLVRRFKIQKVIEPMPVRSWSRYCCFKAEQVITTFSPLPVTARASCIIVSSHPSRSSSVSGMPRLILSILACGCKSSPSIKRTCCCCAMASPTEVFPLPETPITMNTAPATCLFYTKDKTNTIHIFNLHLFRIG